MIDGGALRIDVARDALSFATSLSFTGQQREATMSTPTTNKPTTAPSNMPPGIIEGEPDFDIDDEEDVDDGMEDVINASNSPRKFNIGPRKIILKPGQATRIEREYTVRIKGEGQSGDDLDPVIMRLTGGNVVPSSHPKAKGHKLYKAPKKSADD